ncbi:arginine metabolism transcriptional control protein, putative [Cryptococcus deneoformans JEC21]|uniref:Kinase n=1 Tax=Cryptococcus deneoformans (strain JEC21 / ATCC MYA-565) TaxID=214684 RepID=Q5K6U4_CRYD1|nr:arginine metabolism transcriptional control protein, putative [Cryptococcus neoformans var. neoformans JEC21]AAW47195.1 arginine metabolism transcriptional control protein, putative [Cryptococcus neoformans var. neoformans JEC21]
MDLPLTLDDHTPFPHQVAGHPGVMSDSSGSLVIKPALPREIAFYQLLSNSDPEDIVWPLRKFVPKNYGTLRLEGRVGAGGGVETDLDVKDEMPESVVLENLAYAYTHPNIMDVKLGTVLYAPDATDEKRRRMERQARETTTYETGIRLTGCQTWHAPTQSYISTPKSFGKSITPPQLSLGMVRFFPLPTDCIPSLVTLPSPPPTAEAVSASHFPIPAENSCASVIQSSTSISIPPSTPIAPAAPAAPAAPTSTNPEKSPTYENHSIPAPTLARLLTLLLQKLDHLTAVLSTLEMRFVGASLLVVYEGDPARLEAALDREEANAQGESGEREKRNGERSMFSDDGSIDFSDSDEDSDEDGEGYDSEDELDGKKKDERRARKCPALTLKMIDFAHTWLAQGEGPDEGVLKGLKTFRSLVEERLEEVERGCV